jgi:hypothetical protein
MLDLHPSALDARIHQHDLCVNRANRDGWLPSPARRAGRKTGLGAVLGAVGARLEHVGGRGRAIRHHHSDEGLGYGERSAEPRLEVVG